MESNEPILDKAGRQLHVGDYLVVVMGNRYPSVEFARLTKISKGEKSLTIKCAVAQYHETYEYEHNPDGSIKREHGTWGALIVKSTTKTLKIKEEKGFRSFAKFYWVSQHSLPQDMFAALDSLEIG
jgi:hypothetical protein